MSVGQTFVLAAINSLAKTAGFEAKYGVSGVTHLMGKALSENVIEDPDVVNAETAFVAVGGDLQDLCEGFDAPDSWEAAAAQIALIIPAFKSVISKLSALTAVLGTAIDAHVTDAAQQQTLKDSLSGVRNAFIENVICEALLADARAVFTTLYALGIIRREQIDVVEQGYILDSSRFDFDALKRFLTDPLESLAAPFAWGDDAFDPAPVLRLVAAARDPRLATPLGRTPDGDMILSSGYADIWRDSSISPPGLALQYSNIMGLGEQSRYIMGDSWQLIRKASLELEGEARVTVAPPLKLAIDGTSALSGDLSFEFGRRPEAGPLYILNSPKDDPVAIWVEAPSVAARLLASVNTDGQTVLLPSLEAALKGLSLKVSAGEGDGFLKSVLGAVELDPVVDLSANWSPDAGLKMQASGGMDVSIPINKDVGPVSFNTLDLALKLGAPDAVLRLDAGLGLGVKIGPVAAVVERIGASFALEENDAEDAPPLALVTKFLPPRGLGMSIEAGPAKGGGFLSFDPDRGRYAGALEVDIGEIGISAVGLLTTKEDGFSLVVILSGEFPPIQLGFGFTLNALGGLVGINRTSDVDFLRDGLRSQTLDSLMFPKDPVARAPEIIRDMEGAFPARRGQHIFGPMVRLGWGTPSLITAELGLLLELDSPLRLILMGKLRAGLPTLAIDPQIAKINMDVLGIIDFDRKEASLDAVLYDSRIALYTLEGEMAMRLRWGAQPFFILSIGGVHPAFEKPPELPDLKRLAISLGSGDNPRLRMEAFVAISSNTVQFGAAVDARASAMGFTAEARLGFEALFELSPFSFQAALFARASLKRGNTSIMTVSLDLTLTGPSPYVVTGTATASLFFIDVSVPFNARFGKEEKVPLPLGDPFAALSEALQNPSNWSAELPDAGPPHVRLAGNGEGAVHPLGMLGVRQQILPLDTTLDKFGALGVGDDRHFRIAGVSARLGPAAAPLSSDGNTRLKEPFAPAQFFEMADDEKLSAPSFEPMTAGLKGYGTTAYTVPFVGPTPGIRTSVIRDASRQTLYITDDERSSDAASEIEAELITAATAMPDGPQRPRPGFGLEEKRYVVATKRGLQPLSASGNTDFADIPELDDPDAHLFWAAKRALRAHLERHPGDKGRLIVVAEHELELAA